MELLTIKLRNTSWAWDGGPDTKSHWIRNRKKLGATWTHFNDGDKDFYKFNDLGFRTLNSNEIDWKESVVILGCSYAAGIGLAYKDTISSKLEKIIRRPVINLGQSGSAVDINFFNSYILHNYYPQPKAIVHLWTSLNRYTDFNFNEETHTRFIPTDESSVLHKNLSYCANHNWGDRSKMYIDIDRALWNKKIPRFEGSFFCGDYEYDKNVVKLDIIDRARDLMHPGKQTAIAVAKNIAKNLKEQGL